MIYVWRSWSALTSPAEESCASILTPIGRRSDPNVKGKIRVVNASFASAGAPLGLQNGNGVLTLTRDRLDVTQFQGNVGGGRVTASGGIVYRPQLQFDLALAAKGVRVLYDQSVRTTVGSNLAFTGNFDNASDDRTSRHRPTFFHFGF